MGKGSPHHHKNDNDIGLMFVRTLSELFPTDEQ